MRRLFKLLGRKRLDLCQLIAKRRRKSRAAAGFRSRFSNAASSNFNLSSATKKSSKSRMSPATFTRSPAASKNPRHIRCRVARRRIATSPARCKNGTDLRHALLDRQPLHRPRLERHQLLGVEARRRFVHALQRKLSQHLLARKLLGLVVQRPAEQQQIIDERIRQITNLLVEIDNHRIERLGRTPSTPSAARSTARAP